MDCFDTHYYWLNRRLMIIVGQWPYQNRAEKMKKWIIFLCAVLLQVVIQGGQAMKSDLNFEYCIEFISESSVTVIISLKYVGSAINSGKIRGLLENIKLTWQSLIKSDEHDLFCESVEEGRLYILRCATVMLCFLVPNVILLLMPPLLTYAPISNVSCPILMMYIPDFFIDLEKYCYPLQLCICFIVVTLLVSLYAIDVMYMTALYHAIAMFKIVCYQLERTFDKCTDQRKSSSKRSYVCERIANAVKWHRASTRYCDDIIGAYGWINLISLAIALVGIAMTMYWAVMSKGQVIKVWINVTSSLGQIVLIFMLYVPAQRMLDNSTEVIFKAYSSLWYMAHIKDQILILLTMQRGLKPSEISVGGLYHASLESFAAEIKVSFSYFTLLMSL